MSSNARDLLDQKIAALKKAQLAGKTISADLEKELQAEESALEELTNETATPQRWVPGAQNGQ